MEMTLRNGCCLDLMEEIPDASIDMTFFDLPYGTTRAVWDKMIDLDKMWPILLRKCKKDAAMLFSAQTPFDKILGVSNLPMLRYEIIWEKSQATGHLNARKMPMKAHENILVFYRKLPTYNPQKTTGHKRKVSSATHKRNCNTGEMYGNHDNHADYDSTERYPRSVMKFSSDKQRSNLHSAQKPLPLMEWLIKTYSNEGDTVLDGVMGSGTTGVACKRLGRKFIGFEKDKRIFDIAFRRISDSP